MPNAFAVAAWLGRLLSVGLLLSSIGRVALSVYPAYDFDLPWGGTACRMFVLLVWVCMPGMFFISSAYASTIIKGSAGVLKALVAVITDPRCTPQVLAIAFLKAYELWLIYFIYTTWTVDFSALVQLVQLLPAFALFLHSFFQLFVIAASDRFQWQSAKMVYFARLQVSINVVMLGHLLCTVIKVCSHEPWKLNDVVVLVFSELVFRIMGLMTFRRFEAFPQDSQEVYNGEDTPSLVIAQPVLPSLYAAQPEQDSHPSGASDEETSYLTLCCPARTSETPSIRLWARQCGLYNSELPVRRSEALVLGRVDV